MIDYDVTPQGIAVLTWNLPGRPVNVMNDDSLALFGELIDKALADDAVRGIVIASAKRDFVSGADLATFLSDRRAEVIHRKGRMTQAILRRLETGGKPVCAAIEGTALGGGLEIALACHHRIVSDAPSIRLGLPEVTFGLLPGAGGTQRLPRLIGVKPALPLLLEGKTVKPAQALELGLVDEVVPAGTALERAIAWAAAQQAPVQQPWDRKGARASNLSLVDQQAVFGAAAAQLTARTLNTRSAPRHILSSVFEGINTDIDSGLRAEARHFVACVLSPESQNMTRTLFFGIPDAGKLRRRPADVPERPLTDVGVLGAGMMGRGIAQVSAAAGLNVVLIDSSQDLADKGKALIAANLNRRLGRDGMTEEKIAAILDRIVPTTDYARLTPCQIVVEAVFEDRGIKADVTGKAEAALAEDAIFGTNTSSLPITGLAEASARPQNFIGIHFFSPVDRMQLVEIIRGRDTSDACLAQAMDFVRRLRKVPIVVNDSRGFYTTRVFMSFLNEGLAMAGEGIDPAVIENAARQAGMPVGPLALTDEVSFELLSRLVQQARRDEGNAYVPHEADAVVETFHDRLQRTGRKGGGGFYDYDEAGKSLWRGLADVYPRAERQPDVEELKRRFLYIQGLETVRCLEEGVIGHPLDADIGAVLGWGFPVVLGGPTAMIDTVGAETFVRQCGDLADRHGPRFEPPARLRAMASDGARFHAD